MNIRGLPSNFAGCKYFIKSNLPDVLALYETNFDNSIDSFSVMSNLILVRNDAVTVLHDLAVYVKDRLPFCTERISKKLCKLLHIFSTGLNSVSVLVLFPLSNTFLCLYARFFICFI